MRRYNKEEVKILIELASCTEEAEDILEERTGITSEGEKIKLIEEMFPEVEILDRIEEDPERLILDILLNAVVKKKYF